MKLSVQPHGGRSAKIIVGYIAGEGHSGSTLTDLLLGAQEGVSSFGELIMLDNVARSGLADGRCTCGETLNECAVWGPVLETLRARGLETIATKPGRSNFRETNSVILSELAARTGDRVLIDSSKSPQRLRQLLSLPSEEFDVRVIHLVRDGRAVAHSNTRKGRRFAVWMRRWKATNLDVEALADSSSHYFRLRYEDVVSDPEGALRQLLAFLDVEPPANVEFDWLRRPLHNIGGNRMRLKKRAEITLDTAYYTRLSDRQWRRADRIAGALLRRYRYEDWSVERRDSAHLGMARPSLIARLRAYLAPKKDR